MTDPQSIKEYWYAWLPTIVASGAIMLLWVDIRAFKKTILDELSRITIDAEKKAKDLAFDTQQKAEKVARELHDFLFRSDGTTVYVPTITCGKERLDCQQDTCKKIDTIFYKLDEIVRTRDFAKDTMMQQMAETNKILALLSDRMKKITEK